MRSQAHVQNLGHDPGSRPPESPWSQTLRYGDLTASGIAGGRAGVKDEAEDIVCNLGE